MVSHLIRCIAITYWIFKSLRQFWMLIWKKSRNLSHAPRIIKFSPRFLYFAFLNIYRWLNLANITLHGPDDGSVEPKCYSVNFSINLSFHLDYLVINFFYIITFNIYIYMEYENIIILSRIISTRMIFYIESLDLITFNIIILNRIMMVVQGGSETTWEPINHSRFIRQFRSDMITSIQRLERIKTKICKQKIYCLTKYIYIYIYMRVIR